MYVGSKKNYIHGKYFGSPRNKRAKEIIKTRPETLSVEILETVHDYNLLLEREIYWQQLYDVVNKVAKIKGRKHSSETIEKMRKSAKLIVHKPHTEEHKNNISKGLIGHKSRPRTEEEKTHHSNVMKGKRFPNRKVYVITQEHRNNLSIAIKADWEKRKLKNAI